jgi:FkbM family methyltransferase
VRRVRRQIGAGAVAEYTLSELLDRSRYLYGTYEYSYASAFIGQVTPGSVAVDIGANIGEYTLLAAVSVGPQGMVFAVEPNIGLHPRILRNLDLSGVSNVELLPVALGSFEGEGLLTVPLAGPALGTLRTDVAADEPSTKYEVPVRRLDDVFPSEDRRRLSVMKVDVEGWELEVFIGGRETLAEAKPVVLYECGAEEFERRGARNLTPSMAFLEELGYRNHTIRMDRHGRWRLRAVELTGDPLAEREPWSVLMMVAVHPDADHRVKMSGESPLPRCGLFDLFAPRH